jgi:hypothetical protein
MRANVLDRIEIRTEKKDLVLLSITVENDALVRSKVFDNAAKPVIRIGPKTGWKDSA